MIFVIEDNEVMARCIARAVKNGLRKKTREKKSASEIADEMKIRSEKSASRITENIRVRPEESAPKITEKVKMGTYGSASKITEKGERVKVFHDAYAAMAEMTEEVPEMIFLDILLDGVDGFTFLHELMSYEDTAKVPIIVVTSLKMEGDLSNYGVRGILNKETMTPREIEEYVAKYTK